ncbi:unnamed protein product (macronuclear) [Paramecium tetraurelia]|uniref:Uncharacterized protein n=1 Tax=Paramecium tetraurelia TaxID=5888 RepID=A0E410_PARTE|nr:uncharacterized protein GSPATT00023200001 [Paramecium tetraurelia]CAK90027.1 unnamed protein product [Paramecium tetraurelia]|eukprot:XP_001457424.1 hypothetical protein (macronuclear) [Paramecium tetraurelia strain d4-2]
MNQHPQGQFQFIKTYFLKSTIARQIMPDSSDDISPELLDEHFQNNTSHRRIKSDLLQQKEAQKLREIQQQYQQQTDTSTYAQSYMSQGILKKSQRSRSSKSQKRKSSHNKKVHFI